MALAKILMTVDEMQDRDAWLNARNSGVGGSEVAAVLGRSNWGSPFSVWQRKVDPKNADEIPDTERMKWGRRLEDSVAQGFAEDYGFDANGNLVEIAKANGKILTPITLRRCGLMQRKDKPWMLCSVDRLVVGRDVGVEIKTSAGYMKDEWPEEGLPEQYYLQVQWYMACTGFTKWIVACLLGGNEMVAREVERNDADIKLMEEAVEDFWVNYVVPKKLPSVDGSKYCTEAIIKQHPGSYNEKGENVMELESKFIVTIEDIQKLDDEIKALEKVRDLKKNEIRLELGDTIFGHAGTYNISFKPQTKNTVDSKKLKERYPNIWEECKKTTNTRVLTIKASKDPKRYEE